MKEDGSISGYRWGVRRKKALFDRKRRAVFNRR
jgi:O6-methylguanine-DNA--protein-cysteine methyltransferase